MQDYKEIENNNEIFSISQTIYKQVVAKDDYETKEAIKKYLLNKYPKENIRLDFLDKEIIDKIINLGINTYLGQENLKTTTTSIDWDNFKTIEANMRNEITRTPKQIKIKTELHEYLKKYYDAYITSKTVFDYPLYYYGIPIIIDDTIENDYKVVY